jgi:hypothetical protein
MNSRTWKEAVENYMRAICEQNNLPVGDWPDIPDKLRLEGATAIHAAYILLDQANRFHQEVEL